ncbi:MAG: efflux transporter periplasmic adaptor subunit, partial [Phycisphaerales bacterium JB038]
AVRAGRVCLLDSENRLRFQPVEVLFTQDDLTAIGAGLAAGDRVIVSDPSPAIEGMLVEPIEDTALQERVRRQALEGAAS